MEEILKQIDYVCTCFPESDIISGIMALIASYDVPLSINQIIYALDYCKSVIDKQDQKIRSKHE